MTVSAALVLAGKMCLKICQILQLQGLLDCIHIYVFAYVYIFIPPPLKRQTHTRPYHKTVEDAASSSQKPYHLHLFFVCYFIYVRINKYLAPFVKVNASVISCCIKASNVSFCFLSTSLKKTSNVLVTDVRRKI